MPASLKWTSLLRERPDVWFPPKLIEAMGLFQRLYANSEEGRRIVAELRAEGYRPPQTRPGWQSEDQWVITCFWRELYGALWPEPLAKAIWEKDRELRPDDADALIRFLEIDPYFFRSGYAKPTAIQRLGHCPLTPSQRERIFGILRRIVLSGWERQVTGWRKLARLCDAEKVRGLVVEALASPQDAVVKKGTILGLVLLGESDLLGGVLGYGQKLYWERAIEVVRQAFAILG